MPFTYVHVCGPHGLLGAIVTIRAALGLSCHPHRSRSRPVHACPRLSRLLSAGGGGGGGGGGLGRSSAATGW
jgi:hypothetical protein